MNFFGLNIGSQSIKIAQVEKTGEKSRLIAFGLVPAPAKGIVSEVEADLNQLAQVIKNLHREAKITTKNVVTALPEDKVFTKLVIFPKLSDKELNSAIKWEAEQYVPIPLEEVTLDFQVMREFDQENIKKMEVLLIAAPKKLIEKYTKVIKVAGLSLVSLETEMMALVRSLAAKTETSMLVDLGAKATDIVVVEGKSVFFTRSIPTAGESLTRSIVTGLNLEFNQAEEYKKAYGLSEDKLEGKILDVMTPVLEIFTKEIRKAIQFYEASRKKPIKRIILTGGIAGLPELVNYLAKNLNLEIQMGDPFAKLEKDEEVLKKVSSGIAPFYAVAIGLALKKIN